MSLNLEANIRVRSQRLDYTETTIWLDIMQNLFWLTWIIFIFNKVELYNWKTFRTETVKAQQLSNNNILIN